MFRLIDIFDEYRDSYISFELIFNEGFVDSFLNHKFKPQVYATSRCAKFCRLPSSTIWSMLVIFQMCFYMPTTNKNMDVTMDMRHLDSLTYYAATKKYDLSFPRLTEDLDVDVADGDLSIFVSRPVSLTLLGLIITSIVIYLWSMNKTSKLQEQS